MKANGFKTKKKKKHERNRTAYAKLFLCDSWSKSIMGVEYLPQFQSVTNVMNTEFGENNNLLTFVKKNFLYRPRSYRIG